MQKRMFGDFADREPERNSAVKMKSVLIIELQAPDRRPIHW
jgi:hypothetical protein